MTPSRNPDQVRTETGIDSPVEKRIHVEQLKLGSHGLRGAVLQEMTDEAVPMVSEDSYNLMKHFGMYQQDDRDVRNERKRAGLDKDYSFMIRVKIPGGVASAEQYLALDEVATTLTGGSIRITTRQTIQFHGVGKLKLQALVRALNERLITSYGACGDVVRNVMSCPVADIDQNPAFTGREVFQELARQINDRTLPRTTAFYDIFINGEKDNTLAPKVTLRDETEDLYGDAYLPRKFKIGMTIPQDNCVDIFSQDLGIVAILGPDGKPRGYNIMAGGGMGSSHGNKETFPRIADPVCFVTPDEVLRAVDAVITVQRDYGNRTNRKLARLKYLMEELGPVWYREEMSRRMGVELAPPVPIAPEDWGYNDHLGWHEQLQPGLFYVGIFVENGRLVDKPGKPLLTNIRSIIKKFRPQVRFTGQQNIILANIPASSRAEITAMLNDAGLSTGNGHLSQLRRHEIACVSLPTCGLALAEAERVMPTLMDRMEAAGYGIEKIHIRMSGCPNACSRPPMSEIGIIGRAPNKYNLYTGGDYEGTRLNQLYKESVAFDDLDKEIGRLIDMWRGESKASGEAFGDYCFRKGVEALKA